MSFRFLNFCPIAEISLRKVKFRGFWDKKMTKTRIFWKRSKNSKICSMNFFVMLFRACMPSLKSISQKMKTVLKFSWKKDTGEKLKKTRKSPKMLHFFHKIFQVTLFLVELTLQGLAYQVWSHLDHYWWRNSQISFNFSVFRGPKMAIFGDKNRDISKSTWNFDMR